MKFFKHLGAIALICLFAAQGALALTADEALNKSKEWFKSGKAWNLDFQLQVFMANSPDIVSQKGSLLVAEGDMFKLEIMGIRFYSDGESIWQWNVEQNQVLIKAVEDLSQSLHPSELLFKYLNCKALSLSEGTYNKKKLWVLKLDPSKYAGQFTQMEVWLDPKDFSPVRLYTVDPENNSSWYNIINLKVMKKASVEDFRYKSNSVVDEIDMR